MRSPTNDLYVQFGCGFSAPATWLSFDASPTLRFERFPILGRVYTRNTKRFPAAIRYGDIVKGLPISDNSCAGMFASHVLEHLSLAEFDIALNNVYRYLKPGGTFRLVVPDLRKLANDYLTSEDPLASFAFLDQSYLGKRTRSKSLRALIIASLGNSQHLWMWDEMSMQHKLTEYGFRNVRRALFGDSEDTRFNDVEDAGRFYGCLAMQCLK